MALKPINTLLVIGKRFMADKLAPKNTLGSTIFQNNHSKITPPIRGINQKHNYF